MKNFGVKKVCDKMNGLSQNIFISGMEFFPITVGITVGKIIQTGKEGMSKGIETQTYKFYRQTDRQTDRQTH